MVSLSLDRNFQLNDYRSIPPAEHSSRPPSITGEKREATEHTEQGDHDNYVLD